MAKYLDPKNDLTFKKVFGEHAHLCISLLNALLPLEEGRPITSIEYMSPEMLPRFDGGRNSIVDVRCKDAAGRQFIVEMQLYWTTAFQSRVLLSAAKAYVSQFTKEIRGKNVYKLIEPVYALNLIDDIFEKSPEMADEYYHHYKVVNVKHTEKRIDGLELVFIELPKFKPSNRAERKLHDLWLRFLTEVRLSSDTAPAELLENSETCEALSYLEEAAYTPAQMAAYDIYLDWIMTERAALADSEDIGIAKGRAEGKAEGRAEGIAEGARNAALAIAAKALASGLPVGAVRDMTGLSDDDIRALKS